VKAAEVVKAVTELTESVPQTIIAEAAKAQINDREDKPGANLELLVTPASETSPESVVPSFTPAAREAAISIIEADTDIKQTEPEVTTANFVSINVSPELTEPVANEVFRPQQIQVEQQPDRSKVDSEAIEQTNETVGLQPVLEEIPIEENNEEAYEPLEVTAAALNEQHGTTKAIFEAPIIIQSLEQFETFVAELHEIEAVPEKLEMVHEKVETIAELTTRIQEAQLLESDGAVEKIQEELVEAFVQLFEETGMKFSEEQIRHIVQLWIKQDVLRGKNLFETKSELFNDDGMHEILRQFMQAITKIKEVLESIHVRLGRLVLTQPAPTTV
jgi:hypothetical protein